ncbi:LysR family transcriptional regulator [Roseateles flavus]|uniref:LysR family transcriptional regulator n=1 Tax=Roseateles flavus TaxID=3149041 RepID=A0ABV0GGV1_9BURK
MTDLRTWRQFCVLARELHFGRAAQRLHMTQPPLSLAMQKLEQALGVTLFERSRRSVRLSAAGAALLPQAEALLAQAEALPAVARSAAAGISGRLRLGFVSTVGYGEMPQWLRQFRERFPEVALQLREATLDVQLEAFDRDELDAGFVIHAPDAEPAGFETLRLSEEPMVLAHAEGVGAASPKALLDAPLIIFPREIAPSLHDAVLAFYATQGRRVAIAQEAIQMQTIVNLVSSGMGVAWVPRSVMALQRAGVSYRALRMPGLPRCETRLIWRAPAAPVVDGFVAHVRQALRGSPEGK